MRSAANRARRRAPYREHEAIGVSSSGRLRWPTRRPCGPQPAAA
jgi:hypothetical protein